MIPRILLLSLLLPFCYLSAQEKEENKTVIISGDGGRIFRVHKADVAKVAQLCLAKTNALRKEEKLPPLKQNAELAATAKAFADFMARTKRYGHFADGRSPSERAEEGGYEFSLVLENIAYATRTQGFTSEDLAEGLIDGWKNSPPHREAMVNPFTIETGVGVVEGLGGYFFAVQMFGRPLSESYEYRVVNGASRELTYKFRTEGEDSTSQTVRVGPREARVHTTYFPAEFRFDWLPDEKWVKTQANYLYKVVEEGRGVFSIEARPISNQDNLGERLQ